MQKEVSQALSLSSYPETLFITSIYCWKSVSKKVSLSLRAAFEFPSSKPFLCDSSSRRRRGNTRNSILISYCKETFRQKAKKSQRKRTRILSIFLLVWLKTNSEWVITVRGWIRETVLSKKYRKPSLCVFQEKSLFSLLVWLSSSFFHLENGHGECKGHIHRQERRPAASHARFLFARKGLFGLADHSLTLSWMTGSLSRWWLFILVSETWVLPSQSLWFPFLRNTQLSSKWTHLSLKKVKVRMVFGFSSSSSRRKTYSVGLLSNSLFSRPLPSFHLHLLFFFPNLLLVLSVLQKQHPSKECLLDRPQENLFS